MVEAVTGTYESSRLDATATVSPGGDGDGGSLDTTIEVRIDDWDEWFRAAPDLDADRSGGHAFSARLGDGRRWTVEFVESDGETVMLWSRGPRTLRFARR